MHVQSDELSQLRQQLQAEIDRQTATLQAQIAQQQDQITQQQAEIVRLQAARPADNPTSGPDNQYQPADPRSSRRRMLKKLALTAAGVAAASTALAANSQSAAAYTDTSKPNIGLIGLPGSTAPTGNVISGIGLLGSSDITDFSKIDRIGGGGTPGSSAIGVFGQAKANPIGYGVLGAVRPITPTFPATRYARAIGVAGIVDNYEGGYLIANGFTDCGVMGQGPTGVFAQGLDRGVWARGPGVGVYAEGTALTDSMAVFARGYYSLFSDGIVWLYQGQTAGAPDSGEHRLGELYADKNGVLFYCVAAGTPGTWRTLAGPDITPGLHILPTPERMIDTRSGLVGSGDPTGAVPGFAPAAAPPTGSIRTYTITGRAGQGGTSIPAGATAIVGNVTVVPTGEANGGYLLTYPTGAAIPKTSLLNYNTGQVVANSFVSGLSSSGKISVAAFKTAHVIIDVTGYYL